MLVSYSEDRHGPGPHTGTVLETPDGVRWTVGDQTDYHAGYCSSTHTYAVTASAKTTLDCEGKRRKVAGQMRADFDTDPDEWTIERQWNCDYGETEWAAPRPVKVVSQ